MNAVQFGAGSIGRGFLGQLLFEGGYATTFVDADAVLVAAIQERGWYPLRLVQGSRKTDLRIENVRAVDIHADPAAVVRALAQADLAGTSVGATNLPRIAPVLAAGINARASLGRGPLDILLCENQWHAASLMRDLLLPHLAPDAVSYFAQSIGLVETVIGRMVPAPASSVQAEDPLLVVAEPFQELPVARAALRGPVPNLPGLILADQFEAYEARKLFLHNMSHAALAYLGWPQGHHFLWQCAADCEVAEVCAGAMAEVCGALSAEYSFAPGRLSAFGEDLMRRFANRALGDTAARVAADPLRKLRPQDRLVGAASLCLAHGIMPHRLASVIAAALRYDNPQDVSSVSLQALRRQRGDAEVLRTVCALEPDSALGLLILGSQPPG